MTYENRSLRYIDTYHALISISVQSGLYGFLKELRPSEPFITEYLIEPKWVNITLEEVIDNFAEVLLYNLI